jgi:lipopolysaccharide/colanic/teichoic acid biosynthesis glycosyltransferase
MLKRIFDVVAATAGILVLSPLLVLIAIAIKLDSRGSVLYRGVRVGLNGRRFRMLKFRTMILNAEALGTATAQRDRRITRIGRFLRKYKLDELPQLVNVVRGEMSLVGPRPEVEEHTSVYNDEEQIILTVRPGITDYSSIRFANLGELLGGDDPETANRVFIETYRAEKNRLRIDYVRNRSFLGDLGIIFKTLGRIVQRR